MIIVNFEAKIDRRFQRMEESRGKLLDVVRSHQTSKSTYGDALVILESFPIFANEYILVGGKQITNE